MQPPQNLEDSRKAGPELDLVLVKMRGFGRLARSSTKSRESQARVCNDRETAD